MRIPILYLNVILSVLTHLTSAINQCSFAFSYSSTGFSSYPFYHAAYDSSTDKYYFLVGIDTTLVQHDATGAVLNTLKLADSVFFGLLVPSPGGKIWVHGLAGSGQGLLIVVNDDFTVAYNHEMGQGIYHATSDGNGFTYLYSTIDKYLHILKVQESDYSHVFEKRYSNAQTTGGVKGIQVYASTSTLILLLSSDVYPGWSSNGVNDYVVFQMSTDGTTANAAFGFGSVPWSSSQAMVYMDSEGAVIVPYNDYEGQKIYFAKVTVSTSSIVWSKLLRTQIDLDNP